MTPGLKKILAHYAENTQIVSFYYGQNFQAAYDARRDAYLQNQGLTVLRFNNAQVLKETTDFQEHLRCAAKRLRHSNVETSDGKFDRRVLHHYKANPSIWHRNSH